MQFQADTTTIVAQVEQPHTLQTVTAAQDSNSSGTETAPAIKPARTPGAMKYDEIQDKEEKREKCRDSSTILF